VQDLLLLRSIYCFCVAFFAFVKFNIWYFWYSIMIFKDCKVPDDGESSPKRVGWLTLKKIDIW
jgi:hypothetical protein